MNELSMTEDEIKEHVVLSKANGQTTHALREYILGVVAEALSRHYDGNYSMRCFQSSILIKDILDDLGIRSQIVSGAVCLPCVMGVQPYRLTWKGFWDVDHHIWLMTEFYEVVDLTISQLHLHPINLEPDTHAIPPFWWHPGDYMPSLFKYLPSLERPELENSAHEDLVELKKVLQVLIKEKRARNIRPILYDSATMNTLLDEKNHWAIGCLMIQDMNIALPDWIIRREQQLLSNG